MSSTRITQYSKKASADLAGDYEVPCCVTLIASQAFASQYGTVAERNEREKAGRVLKSVTIPESVKCIEFEAFASCQWLENVTIEPGLRIVASGAFFGCRALKRIALPETVEILGHAVFDGCEKLREAALPESLRKVCADTFESTPVEKSALEGIPADKIIPAMDCWEDQEIMRLDVGCALGLALFPSLFSFLFMAIAIKHIGPTKTAILGALEPVTALLIGRVVFGENLSWQQIIAVIVILGSVTIVVTSKPPVSAIR